MILEMPSPFTGMDPWLESPDCWHNVHHWMISAIYAELNRTLPEGFAANTEESVYIFLPQDRFVPDVVVRRENNFATAPLREAGGVAVASRPVEVVAPVADDEERIPFLQIVTTHGRERVVAVIEILSLINKTGSGREQYLKKQRDVLDSSAHLLEIDLLRGGQYTVSAPEGRVLQAHGTFWDYLVCLHRAGAGERYQCWPFTMREPLPIVSLPLTGEHPDHLLDLPALFNACYDAGPFRRTVDYTEPPVPRLKRSDADWVADWLRTEPA